MTKLQFLDSYIEEQLLKTRQEQRANHTPSGKLSASMLGSPTQWQVLKTIGVPQKELDEYVVRKFERGNHVEEWVLGFMKGIVNKQKFVEYRNTVGYVDALVDMRDWNLDMEVIPHEIKSVSNANFKWIEKGGAKEGHILQGALYALALKSENFAIDYIATDDYRVSTFLFKTADYKDRVDGIITAYDKAMESGVVPVFEPKEKWMSEPKYNNFPEFSKLTPIEIDLLLQKSYPQEYNKLKGIK